ncbi:hypothetical protein HPB48_019983 [Haemaphysalis longicornis]|uniref:Uncharacterized protein n=1 Tax=Haemaphysalis longicornis TaxID=44386 RepID=A0A9J6FQ85_HAELO|nr:hypothetical protein HPB48_019983 [Haemaphysalis longicornis]
MQENPQHFYPSVGQTCSIQEEHRIRDHAKGTDFKLRGLSQQDKRLSLAIPMPSPQPQPKSLCSEIMPC